MALHEFTKRMKKSHTILIPEMLEYHFPILKAALLKGGYRCEILANRGKEVTETGKRFVHNDMCFPAVAIIGQIINALDKGLYSPENIAFLLPQTGGACRASNYFELLKKALEAAGYPNVPVISLDFKNLNRQSGFRITLPMIRTAVKSVMLGDLLMHLAQQTEPYENRRGDTLRLLGEWQNKLCSRLSNGTIPSNRSIYRICREILKRFSEIQLKKTEKNKIGIVGELYIKYCRLGNHETERFLLNHGCEVKTSGFSVYAFYVIKSMIYDDEIPKPLKIAAKFLIKRLNRMYSRICSIVSEFPYFSHLPELSEYFEKSGRIISEKCITGDGWLISAEAAVLIENGYSRILSLNPFGCLISHINCKGITSCLKRNYPKASITAIDCDCDQSEALFQSRLLLAMGKNIY